MPIHKKHVTIVIKLHLLIISVKIKMLQMNQQILFGVVKIKNMRMKPNVLYLIRLHVGNLFLKLIRLIKGIFPGALVVRILCAGRKRK